MKPLDAGGIAGSTEASRSRSTHRRLNRLRNGSALLALVLLIAACGSGDGSAEPVEEITVDWAYYNPVSLVLRDNGWLEEELDGIEVNWVQSAGSNKALEFLSARSIQFGSSAGAAALLAKINGSPIKVVYSYSQPEWTALVTRGDTGITSVEDLAGKKVAVTRGTDPYIFLVRALADHGLTEQDIEVVLLQHADGRNALIDGSVDAWAGLDPMMAQAEIEQEASLFYRAPDLNTWGVLNVDEDFAAEHPEIVNSVIEAYERARVWSLENPDELASILAEAAGLTQEVALRQLGRTDLSTPAIGQVQRDSILGAGLALQESGVIEADVDVEATVDELLDEDFTAGLGGGG
ncbi:MAG TPA: aliphatic sulfonate ABC transporter substrate-binding protein [Acidimicrobiia bacterium]|nr:aliphatic sulfonate ABC transporter substrate-binding protein [Acidimicrobiia bacterium]